MDLESNIDAHRKSVEQSSPVSEIVVFALNKLIEESQKQKNNVWEAPYRKMLSGAIERWSEGKPGKQ